MFTLIDHVGIAVESIDAALPLYTQSFDLNLQHRETVEEQGVDAVLLEVGSSHIELLAPLGPDTPVGKFMAKNGPGLHHVAYRVEDVEKTLNAIIASGVKTIDKTPRVGIRNSKVAFLHPAFTGSVLTEIVQPAEDH